LTAGSVVIGPEYGSGGLVHTVLLVEDEAFVRDVACEILSGAGFRVLKVGTAAEALRAFHNHAGAVHFWSRMLYCLTAMVGIWPRNFQT